MSAVLLDDAEHRRQAETGALARALVVKNGSKRWASVSWSMPVPLSETRRSTQEPAGSGAAGGLGRGHRLQRGLDGQAAAAGHGVAGVDREVHQHLLDLARVGLDRAGLADGADVELEVLADQPPQHAIELADDRVEIDDARLDDLPAGEQQQLAGQGSGALGGALTCSSAGRADATPQTRRA